MSNDKPPKPRRERCRAKNTLPPTLASLPMATSAGEGAVPLTGDRRKLWDDIRTRYELEAASEALLRNACESLERAAQLAAQVTRDGATFKDRFGTFKPNPAANLERDFRNLGSRALQQLAARLEGA
jgi:hypothetical protein